MNIFMVIWSFLCMCFRPVRRYAAALLVVLSLALSSFAAHAQSSITDITSATSAINSGVSTTSSTFWTVVSLSVGALVVSILIGFVRKAKK